MNSFRFNCILILTLTYFLSPMSAFADSSAKNSKLTDLAALTMQDQSIKKLKTLVKQYQGTEKEPELLARLGDLYLERSGISFRISEGTSIKNKSPLYLSSLKEATGTLTVLIQKFPYHALSALSHFKRGKAYKEMEQVKFAKEDFLYIQQHHSDFEYLDSILIDLADFAQDANQHQEALSYLFQIEKMKGSDYLPLALHKAAWSYFNLGLYQNALTFLEKEMNHYYTKLELAQSSHATGSSVTTNATVGVGAENAFLESAFNDYALFYFEAINKKSDFANVDDALRNFERLDRQHRFYGPTVFKFAKLLKAYTLISELDRLRQILVKDHKDLPESGEVALLLFQFHFDRRDYNHLNSLITDLKVLRNEKNEARVESTLSNALAELHKLVLKNKLATERGTLIRPLVSLTESVNELLGKENATALLANYALAETLFELKEYTQATEAYHNLLKPEYATTLESKKLSPSALTLRLLSSRYQELKGQDLFPAKMKIKALKADLDPASKDQLTSMSEWITWLKASEAITKTPEEKPSYVAYELEAHKLLYLYFDREKAVEALIHSGLQDIDTEDGVTSLTLALDTLSESMEYSRLYELSAQVTSIAHLKNKEFLAKAETMKANAHLKITLASKDNLVTLERSQACLKEFKDLKVLNECRNIHAKTAALLGQYELADQEISTLLNQNQDQTHTQSLLLLRADARNKLGRVPEAIRDLTQYQNLTHYEDAEITEQILEYAWFKNDPSAIDLLLKNKEACQGKNKTHCDQYQVARLLDDDKVKTNYQTTFRNTAKASKEVQSMWVMLALKDAKKLPFQDRMILLQRLASSWESLNPLLQIRLFPKMISIVSDALESVRVSAPGIAPLTADTRTIERRMKLMQDVDLTFSKVMKLSWLQVKLKGASELVAIYGQLIQDLKSIQTPPELLSPFIKKKEEIQTAVQNLQAMAFEFNPRVVGPEPASMSPSKANEVQVDTPETLLLSAAVKAQVPSRLWNEWEKAVQEKRRDYLFHLVASFELEAAPIKLISPALKGLVLLLGGAPTEAYALVESAPESPFRANLLNQFERSKP